MTGEKLWTGQDVEKATGGSLHGNFKATGVSIDSRAIEAGDLFIAIKGDTHDGHDHALSAMEKGAAGLLLSNSVAPKAPHVLVPDTQKALQKLAAAARERSDATFVGITGSVGKTSTKEMLLHMASAQGPTHATQGNLNNHLGLPLSLARMSRLARFGIYEIGMNHAGEIIPLTRLLRPHVALITTVGPAHIEFFAEGEVGIAKAKAEIFKGLEKGGTSVLPHDNKHFELLRPLAAAAGSFVSFGRKEGDARFISLDLGEDGSRIEANIAGEKVSYTLPLAGEHQALNSLAALMAGKIAGLDLREAAASLSTYAPLKGRGVKKVFGSITVLDESYNASPLSMEASINVLGQYKDRRRVAVLGEMRELGNTAPEAHAALNQVLQDAGVALVFCCGENMKHLWNALPPAMKGAWAENAAKLAQVSTKALLPGDVVLIKGSHGETVTIKGEKSPTMAQAIHAIEETHSGKE